MSLLNTVKAKKNELRNIIKEDSEKKRNLETKVLPGLLSKQKTKQADFEGVSLVLESFNNDEEIYNLFLKLTKEYDDASKQLHELQFKINELDNNIVKNKKLKHGYINIIKFLKGN